MYPLRLADTEQSADDEQHNDDILPCCDGV